MSGTKPAKVKLFGETRQLAVSSRPWNFESRSGGWIVAWRVESTGKCERIRFQSVSRGTQFGITLDGLSLYGERVIETRGGGAGSDQDSGFIAQFPGKVRKILVQDGAKVKAGEPLVLLEAMKMEFAMKAPKDGVVVKILVKEAQQISPGDQVLEFKIG